LGLKDFKKTRKILSDIVEDLQAYCGEQYKLSINDRDLSILIEPSTKAEQIDMIDR
jgi:hypothetical protein